MNYEIVINRQASINNSTIGRMTCSDGLSLVTLEDVVRELPSKPVADWKVKGKTAIPRGRYRVAITPSARFGRDMPLLLDVPGFDGVRIHPGNTEADTEGCILVGLIVAGSEIRQSKAAFAVLFDRLRSAIAADRTAWVTIS